MFASPGSKSVTTIVLPACAASIWEKKNFWDRLLRCRRGWCRRPSGHHRRPARGPPFTQMEKRFSAPWLAFWPRFVFTLRRYVPAARPLQPVGRTHRLCAGWVEQSWASARPVFWGGSGPVEVAGEVTERRRSRVVHQVTPGLLVISGGVRRSLGIDEPEADRHGTQASLPPVPSVVQWSPAPSQPPLRFLPVAQKTGSKRRPGRWPRPRWCTRTRSRRSSGSDHH